MTGLKLPTALDQLLMKVIEVNGVAVPVRTALNLTGSVAWTDNPTNDSTDVVLTPAASAWQTALDLSFDVQPNQTFSTDTTFSFAGMTWTKYRSAADAAPLANVNGSGLVVQPSSASGNLSAGSIPFPRLALAFDQFMPSGFDVDWPLRIMARVTSLTSGADTMAALFTSCTPDLSAGLQAYFSLTKGQTDVFSPTASNHLQSGSFSYTDAAAYSAYDTLALYLPDGIAGGLASALLCSNLAPPLFWIGATELATSGSNAPTGGNAGLAANWSVSFGAARNATATSVTFQRFRVQYLAR